ncbi:MAG: MFS transporter [Nanoarchaeota archaeon]|nr:MFS transporter [Nanoarchaeota archaeon]
MKLTKEVLTIALIMFTEIIGWSLILPFLPYYAQDLGATPLIVGLILSSFSIFQFISSPIIGKLSDRFGRKPLLIISQLSTLAGFLILGFANSVWMLFFSRIVDGLFGSNMTLSRAYLTDITEGKERGKTFGMLSAVFGFGFFIGPAVGGFLATINYSIPAFAAAGVVLLSIILTVIFLKETVKRKKGVKLALEDFFPIKDFLQGVRNKELKELFTQFFFYTVAFTLLTANLALIVGNQLGFGPDDVGLLLMIVGLTRVFFQLLALPKLLDRFAEAVLAITGSLILASAMFSVFFMSSRVGLYITMVLFSVGAGLAQPMIITSISNKAPKEERGKVMGVTDSLMSIGQIIGPLIGGFIINTYYPGWVGVLAGCLMLVSTYYAWCNLKGCDGKTLKKIVKI